MLGRESAALAVALLVVLAGCAAPVGPDATDGSQPHDSTVPTTGTTDRTAATADPTTATTERTAATTTTRRATTGTRSTTATTTARVVTEGFDPEYDPVRVLERVEALRGVTASERVVVRAEGLPETVAENRSFRPPRRFFDLTPLAVRTLQYASSAERVPVAAPGSSRRGYAVRLLAADPLRERYGLSQEVVLAHEYVHVLQRERGVFDPPIDASTTDGTFTTVAVVEGDALVVERQYHERYVGGDRDGRFFTVAARNATPDRDRWLLGLSNAAYYAGYRYYARTTDSPTERDAALRDPPSTTAGVLHPNRSVALPGDPVPAPAVPDYEVASRDRVGELAIRFAFRVNDVPYAEASAAADGWRNDSLATYYDAGPEAVYWGTRWANASEAREFATAWRALLDSRNATTNGSLVTVPGTETTPTMHYVVVVDGPVVHVVAAETPGPARDVAAALNATAPANDATSS